MPTAAGFKRGFNKGEMKNDALFVIGFDLLVGETVRTLLGPERNAVVETRGLASLREKPSRPSFG